MTGIKLLKGVSITLVLLLVLFMVLLSAVDFGFLKPKIESIVQEKTGRTLKIEGDLSLKLLPTPTLLMEGVTLASPSWGSEPQMLQVGKAYVEVDLFSLLSSPLVIQQLTLSDARLLVEVNSEDQINWDLGTATEAAEPVPAEEQGSDSFSIPVTLSSAEITNIEVIYRLADTEDLTFTVKAIEVTSAADLTTRFEGEGRGMGQAYTFTGSALQDHLELDAKLADVNLQLGVDVIKSGLDFNVKIGALADLGQLFAVDDLPNKDLSLEGSVIFSSQKIILDRVVAALDDFSLTLDAKVDTSLGVVELKPFVLAFADSELEGEINLELKETPKIRLQAQSEMIDVSPYFSAEHDQFSDESTEPVTKAGDRAYVFQDTPIPTDSLQVLDFDIDIAIDRFVVRNNEFKDVKLKAIASDGTLDVVNSFNGKKNGHYENKLTLVTQGESVDVTLNSQISDSKFALLSGGDIADDQVPVTNLKLNLKSAGHSPRGLASNLDGSVILTQGAGNVSNELIDRFSGDILAQLISALNPLAKEEKFTHWNCSLLALQFESGDGSLDGFLLQSDKLMVVGGGTVDLNDETLDIEFNTKPRTGVGISADMFVTPFVKLSGTLAQPSVGLNKKGALLSGGAAILTGGMSFLYTGVMDRATADADRCSEVTAYLDKHQ